MELVEELLRACEVAKAQIKKQSPKKALPILRTVIARAKRENENERKKANKMGNEMEQIHTHLGDGVYAAYDGYGVMLDLRGQDSFTKIYLEPEVLKALNTFVEKSQAQLIAEAKATGQEPEAEAVVTTEPRVNGDV